MNKDGVQPITDPIIGLDDIRLTLASRAGPVEILRGVSLAAITGETLGLTGPSGSGKSTLLLIIAGLERASAGRAIVAGHDLARLGEDALARFRRDNVGIVFQSFHLIPNMTALENVAVPLEFAGRRDDFDRAEAALEEVGLSHRLSHYPAQLSGGEQQRVALARALAPEPAILLADEPTGNLDSATGAQIIDLLFALQARRGTTLVLVTHDSTLARKCGRVLCLEDGRLSAEAPDLRLAGE